MKDSQPLTIEDYELFTHILSKVVLSQENFSFSTLIAFSRFLEALWLSFKSLQWTDPDTAIKIIESLGKSSIRTLVSLIKGLPEIASKLNSPSELNKIERHLFILYIVHVSPVDFLERSLKFASIVNKLDVNTILFLLTPFMIERSSIKPKQIDDILLITQEKEPTITSAVNPLLEKLMNQLHDHAIKELKVHDHWINYFISTLENPGLDKTWSSGIPRSGWPSFNTCILVLEVFATASDIFALKEKLTSAFVDWSHKVLRKLIDLVKVPAKDKAELVADSYNGYMLPIFTFYGYLSKNNVKLALVGTELAIETIEGLMQSKLSNFLTQKNASGILGSLYFLFSFMCKQIGKHMMEGTNEFIEKKDRNYIVLGLKLFKYVIKCIKASNKENVKEKSKKSAQEENKGEIKMEEAKSMLKKEVDVNVNNRLKHFHGPQ